MKKAKHRGSSTLEILVAFAILTLSITAVVMIGFGNQAAANNAEVSNDALVEARLQLELAKTNSRRDFQSVVSNTELTILANISYLKTFEVVDITQCTKKITSRVSWEIYPNRSPYITISSLLTDPDTAFALGGDCKYAEMNSWNNPYVVTSASIVGSFSAQGVDIKDNYAYVVGSSTSEDLFVFQFNEADSSLIELSKLDIGVGLNDVDVAGEFVYLASASSTNTASSDEFLIVDIKNTFNPNIVARKTLGITPNCPTFCPGGAQTIYYYDERVYIGTHRISGNELSIYDVSHPVSPVRLGGFNVNHNINDIVVRENLAYLATSDNAGELLIFDISNPNSIIQVGSFDANQSANDTEDGLTVSLLGNRIFLGRDRVNGLGEKDFYILDVTNPNIPVELGSKNLGLTPGAYVSEIGVRGNLVFLGISDPSVGFKIFDVTDPSDPQVQTLCSALNLENITGLDMEDEFIFTSHSTNADVRVVKDNENSCS